MKLITLGLVSCLLFTAALAGGMSVLVSTLVGTDPEASATQAAPAEPPTPVGNGDIVWVKGIQVHRSIAGNVVALLEAAKVDGLILEAWGYRPTSRQIELRIKHCGGSSYYSIHEKPSSSCSPPTARPGRSQHEFGLALDFKNCSTRATVCYRWLAQNASRFGLRNLPSEAWHWSTTGR